MAGSPPTLHRAKLISLSSPELEIDHEYPPDPECFVILLEAEIGVEGLPGGDLFRIHACTPLWLAARVAAGGEEWGHGLLVVSRWDAEKIRLAVAAMCNRATGKSWADIALRLSRFSDWEFAE